MARVHIVGGKFFFENSLVNCCPFFVKKWKREINVPIIFKGEGGLELWILLVRVKLGYPQNFTVLADLEVGKETRRENKTRRKCVITVVH